MVKSSLMILSQEDHHLQRRWTPIAIETDVLEVETAEDIDLVLIAEIVIGLINMNLAREIIVRGHDFAIEIRNIAVGGPLLVLPQLALDLLHLYLTEVTN